VLGLDFSPVKGPEGNIEYLILLERSDSPELCAGVPKAKEVVTASHASLDK
jgi:23S rRNA (cytidine1920-2'-O)/16S rRNA (cytidine1409-2'-O)-methyltransferase